MAVAWRRAFGNEIKRHVLCGWMLRIIASIEKMKVVSRILAHRERKAQGQYQEELPLGGRAPSVQPTPFSSRR